MTSALATRRRRRTRAAPAASASTSASATTAASASTGAAIASTPAAGRLPGDDAALLQDPQPGEKVLSGRPGGMFSLVFRLLFFCLS